MSANEPIETEAETEIEPENKIELTKTETEHENQTEILSTPFTNETTNLIPDFLINYPEFWNQLFLIN